MTISPYLIETPHAYATEAEMWACAEDVAEFCGAPSPTRPDDDRFPVFAFTPPIITRRGIYLERDVAAGVLAAFKANADAWGDLPTHHARLVRELEAAIAEHDAWKNENPGCADHLPPPSAGLGGKPQSLARTRPSTRTTPTKATTPLAASNTACGSRGLSSPPASGGSPARSTLRRASFSPTNDAAPKSTAGQQTPGEHGHG